MKNQENHRFETTVNNITAYVEYNLFNNGINFTHTEVPVGLEGKGVGSGLAKFVLDYAQQNSLRVMPL